MFFYQFRLDMFDGAVGKSANYFKFYRTFVGMLTPYVFCSPSVLYSLSTMEKNLSWVFIIFYIDIFILKMLLIITMHA